MRKYFYQITLLFLLSTQFAVAIEPEVQNIDILLENHRFYPSIIEIEHGQKVRITICNKDNTMEEFDSIDLKREKIIPSNTCVHVILAPLKIGKYEFIGEFHPETALGYLIVK